MYLDDDIDATVRKINDVILRRKRRRHKRLPNLYRFDNVMNWTLAVVVRLSGSRCTADAAADIAFLQRNHAASACQRVSLVTVEQRFISYLRVPTPVSQNVLKLHVENYLDE